MSGIYLLLSFIGFGVIAAWFVRNDKSGATAATTGLLRMKDDLPAKADGNGNSESRIG